MSSLYLLSLYSSLLYIRFFFPTCQVRVVRFYVSLLLILLLLLLVLLLLRLLLRRLAVSSEPRPSALCVPCRTSTPIVCALCSLPDLNRDRLRSVFPAGPQPRPSALSVPCRTSAASDHLRSVVPALSVPCRTSTAR